MTKTYAVYFALAFVGGFAAAASACARSDAAPGGDVPVTRWDASSACTLCVTDTDCSGGICSQIASDSYCAPPCPNGDECSSDSACTPVTTVEGEQKSVCVSRSDVCGTGSGSVGGGGSQGGSSGTGGGGSTDGGGCTGIAPVLSDTCGTLDGPTVVSACSSCGTRACQANGCYGGWWCNTTTSRCQSPPSPSSCPPPADAGTPCPDGGGTTPDAGGSIDGSVGPSGGSLSRLLFAVVGDTRPAVINDTGAYPTAIITKIWSDIEASSPRPPFAVSTGDYVFSTANGTQAAPQMDLYLQARSKYSGIAFPAMGNHECTGATTSNCGTAGVDGTTVNFQTFVSKMLTPLGKTSPNYWVSVNAIDGSWTSKLVFIAGNAWASSDTSWLNGVLSIPTTYTFIVRHEPKAAASPGTAPSEQVMAQHPYTLAIVGHTHTYGKTGPKQVTIGNGGAPLTGGVNYGYGLVAQRADGTIQVDMIDSASGQSDIGFRFAVHPNGTPAP